MRRRTVLIAVIGALLSGGIAAAAAVRPTAAKPAPKTPASIVVAQRTVSAGAPAHFRINAHLRRLLAPGVTAPLNLRLINPHPQPITVTALAVTLGTVSNSRCAVSNFTVTQYRGRFPLVVPGNASRTLTQLGTVKADLPQVGMVNLHVNQDVCKSVKLTLAYTGAASLGGQ